MDSVTSACVAYTAGAGAADSSTPYVVGSTVAEAIGTMVTGWVSTVAGNVIVVSGTRYVMVGAGASYSATGAGAA